MSSMSDRSKKTLRINYCDYSVYDGPSIDVRSLFSDDYDVVLCDEPDFLICFNYGGDFLRYRNCVKIFFYSENVVPDFNYYDYAIGMHDIAFGDRHLCVPSYAPFLDMPPLDRSNPDCGLARRKFCNFVYWNASVGSGAAIRQEFCEKLMLYKHVDCPGKVLNNMKGAINDRHAPDWISCKIEFLKNYKFTIAFENACQIGYTTEKLYHPFIADSVPIYWGNPDVARDFNPKAFVNCNDYDNNLDEVVKRVVELDNDDSLYMGMLRENPLNDGCRCEKSEESVKKFLAAIFEKGNKPFYRDEHSFSVTSHYLANHKTIAAMRYCLSVAKYLGYGFLAAICPVDSLRRKKEKYRLRMNMLRAWGFERS
jgi:hypothetical protein